MKLAFQVFLLSFLFIMTSCNDDEASTEGEQGGIEPPEVESLYFPPVDGSEWETTSPTSLGWDESELDELIDFVGENNSKSFLVLQNGRMVVEEYFDGHGQDVDWTWFSTVKSLVSVGVGIAEGEGLIDTEAKTSDYLGEDWSRASAEKQDLIKVKNHLTMSTGLVNSIGNVILWSCTEPACMRYDVDADTKWTYHQGAYTLSQDIISNATGINFKEYLQEKVGDKIGITGSWDSILDIRLFNSNSRGMARFGLLTMNEGNWDGEQIYPLDYHQRMISTSQPMNPAYGYLWWLNGKDNFILTQDQTSFEGTLIPNAPSDMFAALGANDQKIYVIPSLDMVVIRTGDAAESEQFALSNFDNELWGRIMKILP